MYNGLVQLPVWGYIVLTLVLTHITIAAVTIYLHRYQAHRALKLHPVAAHFFRFWLWLTTGMRTKEWASIHRKHHARVETEEDPHSPKIYGISKVFWQGAELYQSEARNEETLEKFGHGTPNDWLERHIYNPRNYLGISLMLVIDVVLFGAIGLTIWAVQMIWIPVFAAGVINGIGHWWGYRNYESPDLSTNIVPWGILIGGEELHNNHHAFGSSARLSSKWWEFDIGWMYIRLMSMCGLAKVKKAASRPQREPDKGIVDLDTVRAVISNRIYIMADYGRDVINCVHRDELRNANEHLREMLKPLRKLMNREDLLMDEECKLSLKKGLELNNTLDIVYQFRQRLQAIWKERSATPEKLLETLQEWCRQAEETGIRSLQDFAQTLRGYTMQPA